MKVLILIILMFIFNIAYASILGNVEKYSGVVRVTNNDSIKKNKIEVGYEIKSGDLISTLTTAQAVLKLSDGSNIVLSEKSSIHFTAENNAQQKSGRIYYKITSRDAKNSLKIQTPFAIIGIKGTTFIINSDAGKESVSLKEGLIGITSLQEPFALYRKETLVKYNVFLSDKMNQFKKFKNPGQEAEPEMRKEFDLEEKNSIFFNNNEVEESGWDENDDAEFDEFEKLLSGSLKHEINTKTDRVKESDNSFDDEEDDLKEPSALNDNDAVKKMKKSMNF